MEKSDLAVAPAADRLSNKDEEAQDQTEKLPYPKSVFFIISNEFCERFSYYGMRTILSIYLTDMLLYSEKDAKVLYHAFTVLVYFFPLLGAMVADSWLGKFRTILYVSMIYACGNIVLAISAIGPINLPMREFAILGMVLIAVGTGGIKPCVSAFGGDQFKLPQQELQLAVFFSMFYFSINAGSLISTAVTPVLRENVHCFDEDSCFSLAFGIPGILMIISIVVFAFGKPLYVMKKPEGNMLIKVSKCIGTAIKQKSSAKEEKKAHWLDYAVNKHGIGLVEDVKATLKVLVLYIPLPVFWALFDQQGTGWTFQARRMDGYIGFYTILPDQMQVINPLLILAFIPMFQYGIYPALNKCRFLTTPLQRMTAGGVLAAISFAISACISLALENTYPIEPSAGNAQLRIYNTWGCDVNVSAEQLNSTVFHIEKGGFYKNIDITLNGSVSYSYSIKSGCEVDKDGNFDLQESTASGYFLQSNSLIKFEDDVSKASNGYSKVRTLVNTNEEVNITYKNDEGNDKISTNSSDTASYSLSPGTYTVYVGSTEHEINIYLGGVYVIMATTNSDGFDVQLLEITAPNSIHMLWLIPQYVIITMGEIMYSITGLEFSYSQAPSSMKSVLQAGWLLTTCFGNIIVIIIESAEFFERESYNFFLYAGLMLVDMGIFSLMAMRYKYVKKEESSIELTDSADDGGVENPNFKKATD